MLTKEEQYRAGRAKHFKEFLNREESTEILEYKNEEHQQTIRKKRGKRTTEENAEAF